MSDLELTTLLLMAAAAFGAGWIDAVVGGAALVQLLRPALALGHPGAAARNEQARLDLRHGDELDHLRAAGPPRPADRPADAAWAFLGAIGGALIGLHIPKSAFNPIILVMLVIVGGYTVARPKLATRRPCASTATGTPPSR